MSPLISIFRYFYCKHIYSFPYSSVGKESLSAMQETPVRFLGWEDPLEEGVAALSSILASLLAQLVKNPSAIQETPV